MLTPSNASHQNESCVRTWPTGQVNFDFTKKKNTMRPSKATPIFVRRSNQKQNWASFAFDNGLSIHNGKKFCVFEIRVVQNANLRVLMVGFRHNLHKFYRTKPWESQASHITRHWQGQKRFPPVWGEHCKPQQIGLRQLYKGFFRDCVKEKNYLWNWSNNLKKKKSENMLKGGRSLPWHFNIE